MLVRSSIVDDDLFSTCPAVTNLWLGAGGRQGRSWVSIVDQTKLASILNLPTTC